MQCYRIITGLLLVTALSAHRTGAQVTVNPTGVNVLSQGATTVFLTFGGVTSDLLPAEAFWCGELIDATPDIGMRCDPNTLFGSLPIRFDLARLSGTNGFTDIMSIPPSVARRAYQAAAAGQNAGFFYVRRFASRSGGRDVFVAVTCRLTAGGAGVPLSLTDVRVSFANDMPVVALDQNGPTPLHADITYTGTGRLQGRWEVVLPGEEPPTDLDLLTEASLPLEERGPRRRYTQLERFNVFLPPTGSLRLQGPDPARLPRDLPGTYLILLRIEASDDRDSQSDLRAVSAGSFAVASGAVAGFPMPTLRYVVGATGAARTVAQRNIVLTAPLEDSALADAPARSFSWVAVPAASRYRLEIESNGELVFEAVLPASTTSYRPPPILQERAGSAPLHWRIRAEDTARSEIARSAWVALTLVR